MLPYGRPNGYPCGGETIAIRDWPSRGVSSASRSRRACFWFSDGLKVSDCCGPPEGPRRGDQIGILMGLIQGCLF